MKKTFSVRVRTFLIPLISILSYIVGQILNQFIVIFLFAYFDNTTSAGAAEILHRHEGFYVLLLGVLMLAVLLPVFVWRRSGKNELTTGYFPRIPLQKPKSLLDKMTPIIALGMLGMSTVYFLSLTILAQFFPAIKNSLQNYEQVMETSITGVEILYYAIGVGVLLPIVEEVLFRGLIMGEFLKTMHPILAIFFSSLLFGAMHMQPVQIGYALLCGAFLGVAYYLTGNLMTACLIHIIYNILGGLPSVLPEPMPTIMQMILNPLFLLSAFPVAILLLILAAKRKKTPQV